jgi:hypothetical protein
MQVCAFIWTLLPHWKVFEVQELDFFSAGFHLRP